MPAISVILPIYNAEPFLSQCLQSIKDQTLKDIEVLCVNDGSTDNSLDTIKAFAKDDERFIVLDKPNGGYGHSLNYGLSHAQGAYISIIEPDDFIDQKMYEELYDFAASSNYQADIVKGSYWEYFDARSDFGECLRKPTIIREMKQVPYSFTLSEDAEVFAHHPSIWSALYRKDFLDSNSIRFVEPKGAGWADNPFLAETLIKAKQIIWVPKGYYYYRQTNPGASSFLKDFHIPFDRLREMREILNSQNANEEIWGAFYRREFDYIRSIINEFGFEEKNPEIYSLIHEVLLTINETILCTSRYIRPEDISYYNHFIEEYNPSMLNGNLSKSIDTTQVSTSSYVISFIVPIKNRANLISDYINNLQDKCSFNHEIILAECNSSDRSMATCIVNANKYQNVTVMPNSYKSIPEGINNAMDRASGNYIFILDPANSIDDDFFNNIVEEIIMTNCDMGIIDPKKRFVTSLMCSTNNIQVKHKDADIVISNIIPNEINYCLFNLVDINNAFVIYKTQFIKNTSLRVNQKDASFEAITLAYQALTKASSLLYAGSNCIKQRMPQPNLVPFLPDLHEELVVEPPTIFPGVIDTIAEENFEDSTYLQSKSNLFVSLFMNDVTSRCFPETLYDYVAEYLPKVQDVCNKVLDGKKYFDVEEYYDFQIISKKGLKAYLATQFLYKSNDVKHFQNTLDAVFSSVRYTVGSKLVDKGSKLLSGRLQNIVKRHL